LVSVNPSSCRIPENSMPRPTTMPGVLAILTIAAAVPLAAQSPTDSAAVKATALDYIEGWYEADAVRMERALHPHLAKRFLEDLGAAGLRLTDTSALELVAQVRAGGGSSVPPEARRTEVRILDIFQAVASVRVDAGGWIDYMHLARFGDEWKIVNVLWEIRIPDARGPAPAGGDS
jgi:hypothetical protein